MYLSIQERRVVVGDDFRPKIKDIPRWNFATVRGLSRKLPLSVRFLVHCVDAPRKTSDSKDLFRYSSREFYPRGEGRMRG